MRTGIMHADEKSPYGIDVPGRETIPGRWTAAAEPPRPRASVPAESGLRAGDFALLMAGLAALGGMVMGIIMGISQDFTLAPAQIYAWVGVVFAAVMMGGLGSPIGPLVAGIIIGVSEALTMAITAPSWAPIVSFTLLIVLLLVRPGRL